MKNIKRFKNVNDFTLPFHDPNVLTTISISSYLPMWNYSRKFHPID